MSGNPAITFQDQTGTPYGIKRLGVKTGTDKDNIPIFGLSDSGGNVSGPQYPIAVDGDSVYTKDIKSSLNDVGTFTGADLDTLFNNLDDSITDSSATNPKWFQFYLERPARVGSIALVAKTGNFSNVKITFKDRQGTVLDTIDDSANNTKYTSHKYVETDAINACCVLIEFYTADAVTVSFAYVRKILTVSAVISGEKPNGEFVNFKATANGNFKVSLEEFDGEVATVNADRTTNLDGIAGLNTNAMTFGRISDTVVKNLRSDASTESLMTVSYEHHEIHSGTHFFHNDVHDLSINAVLDYQITTPAGTKFSHFLASFNTESETDYFLYEGVTINVAGADAGCFNSNRNSGTACTLVVNEIENSSVANANSDTVVSGADVLKNGIIGAGRTGGESSRSNELILKADTIYCLRFVASAAGYINTHFEWYEHTDRN